MSSDTFRTLDEADVRGKRVLVRVDLNVPVENGKIADTTRIERVAPTIREIADKGGKVILLSHFGRPKGPDPAQSLKLLTPAIAAVLKRPVAFAEDCIGERAAAAVNAVVAAIRHPMAGDTSRRARRSTSTCFRNSTRRRSPISASRNRRRLDRQAVQQPSPGAAREGGGQGPELGAGILDR
jgi:hypothetical protein